MNIEMGKAAYDIGEAIPYVDSRIYSDRNIFEEEFEKIWKKVWLATVHESELPEALDFRTMTLAREPIIIVRGSDKKVRAFLNVCPHRGNLIVRSPAGSFISTLMAACLYRIWRTGWRANLRPIRVRSTSSFPLG